MPYPNEFFDLQTAIKNRLTATDAAVPAPAPVNGTVTWLTEIVGDLASEVAKALGAIGISGLIVTPGGDRTQLRDPEAGRIDLVCPVIIQIEEDVLTNQGPQGTKIHALDLVKFCMKRIHFWDPKRASASDRNKLSPTIVTLHSTPFERVSDNPTLIYHVFVNAPLAIV